MVRTGVAHSVTRGAFYLAIERGAALLSGILYFVLLLRWQGPTKYGLMTLALSFVGIATMATGNLEMYLERFAAEFHARRQYRTLHRAQLLALGIKTLLGVLAAIALMAAAPALAVEFSAPELAALLPLLMLVVATDGLSTTGRATLFGLQEYRWVSGLSLLFHVAKTVMVAIMWWTGQGLVALAIGFSALALGHGLLVTAVPLWRIRTMRAAAPVAEDPVDDRALLRSMFGYCAPLLGARATFTLGQNLNKIVLGKLFTPTELGYFSFAFQTLERFVELAYTLPSSLLPTFTELVTRGEMARLRTALDRGVRVVQVGACVLAAGLLLFAREITLFVGSPLFEPAIPLLQLMALVPLARTAQQPLTMLFQAMHRPAIVFRLEVLKFVLEYGSYFLLVPLLGMAGAPVALIFASCAALAAALAVTARLVPAGAAVRARSVVSAVLVFAPLVVAGLLADRWLAPAASLAARLAVMAAVVPVVLATGLVTDEDMERFGNIPLGNHRLKGVRDAIVRKLRALGRSVRPWGAAT